MECIGVIIIVVVCVLFLVPCVEGGTFLIMGEDDSICNDQNILVK